MDDKLRARLRARLSKAYDAKVAERDALIVPAWKRAERDAFIELMKRSGCKSVLEIGCGPGTDALHFRQMGLDVTCIDTSPNMVEACRDRNITAHVMDCMELDFPDASFDAMYAMNSLLHVPKSSLPNVLARIGRIVRPEGLIYIGVWGGRDFEGISEHDEYEPKRFFAFYRDDALREIIAEHFDIISFKSLDVRTDDKDVCFQSIVASVRVI
ncbi:MAG: class I SAM-dependent methyltransferase [bacterium]|nr:class I SAM-dependent methyltransferase [Candidatus Kapabacteria bacterium]